MTPTQSKLHHMLMQAQQTEQEPNHIVTVMRMKEHRNTIMTWVGSAENALRRVVDAYIEKHMKIHHLYPGAVQQRACYVCVYAVESTGARWCMHPQSTVIQAHTLCTMARSNVGQCGPEAKLLKLAGE
jgi:hypothetical protein